MAGPLTKQPNETTAEFRLRIEQTRQEMAAKRTPPAPSAPAPAPQAAKPEASVPTPPPQPTPTVVTPTATKPAQPNAEPPLAAAPVTPTPPAKADDKVDHLEWAKNKGLKTPEDIARSLRALETEFHRRNQSPTPPVPPAPSSYPEQPRPSVPYQPPPPPYQPPASGGYPPPYQPAPRYAPPAPLRKRNVEWLAETYQIPVEDVERLAPMIMDLVAAREQQSDQRFSRLERDNARNGEMFRLMQDPSFQNPEVQFEMHRILEAEPRIFELEPAPYTVAFQAALQNIARKYVANGRVEIPVTEAPSISTRPPAPLGGDGGSGGSAGAGEAPLDDKTFARLPLDKKREVLASMGARPTI